MGSARGGRPRLGNSLLTDNQNQDDKWKFLLLDKQGPVLLLLYVNVCLRYGRWASGWASRQAGQRWWARPRRQKYRARTALPTGPAGPFSRTARADLEKRRTADNLAGENVSRTLSLEQRVAWAGERGQVGQTEASFAKWNFSPSAFPVSYVISPHTNFAVRQRTHHS